MDHVNTRGKREREDPRREDAPAQKRVCVHANLATNTTGIATMQFANGNNPVRDDRLGPRKLIQR